MKRNSSEISALPSCKRIVLQLHAHSVSTDAVMVRVEMKCRERIEFKISPTCTVSFLHFYTRVKYNEGKDNFRLVWCDYEIGVGPFFNELPDGRITLGKLTEGKSNRVALKMIYIDDSLIARV